MFRKDNLENTGYKWPSDFVGNYWYLSVEAPQNQKNRNWTRDLFYWDYGSCFLIPCLLPYLLPIFKEYKFPYYFLSDSFFFISLSHISIFYLILFCKTPTEHFPSTISENFSWNATALCGHRPSHFWGLEITQRHTTLGRTPVDQWWASLTELYLKTHNTHKKKTLMCPVGFEPAIPPSELPQTYALDRAATRNILFYLRHTQCVKPAPNGEKSNQLSGIWNCA